MILTPNVYVQSVIMVVMLVKYKVIAFYMYICDQ